MSVAAGVAFDRLATKYDATWPDTANGRAQREAVWRQLDSLFAKGNRILDLGCGTGTDALHFMERGIEVFAIDASAEMARIAHARGVKVQHMTIEGLACNPQILNLSPHSLLFDAVLSDFGALNCVQDLRLMAPALARLIRPRGYLAICLMGRCCAWETLYYLSRMRPKKAFRRWCPGGTRASIGVQVYYHSVRGIIHAFKPEFSLLRWCGLGLCVPPSYVKLSDEFVVRLASVDQRLAHVPFLRSLADHRLLIFQRWAAR